MHQLSKHIADSLLLFLLEPDLRLRLLHLISIEVDRSPHDIEYLTIGSDQLKINQISHLI
jgi:hypothetical protein